MLRLFNDTEGSLDARAAVELFRAAVLPDLRPDERVDAVIFGLVSLDLPSHHVGKFPLKTPPVGVAIFTESRMIVGHVSGRTGNRRSSQSVALDGSADLRVSEFDSRGALWVLFDINVGSGWHRVLLTNRSPVMPTELGGGKNLVEDAKMISNRLAAKWSPTWIDGELTGWGVDA